MIYDNMAKRSRKVLDYRTAMEMCEEHINKHTGHTGEFVTAKDLADMSGYSVYHFCHVFRAYFDMSVGEYVRRCALNKAASDILSGIAYKERFNSLP